MAKTIANNAAKAGLRLLTTGTGRLIEATINVHVVTDPEELKAAEEAGKLFARLGSAWVACCSDESADELRDKTWAHIEGLRVIRH